MPARAEFQSPSPPERLDIVNIVNAFHQVTGPCEEPVSPIGSAVGPARDCLALRNKVSQTLKRLDGPIHSPKGKVCQNMYVAGV